MTLDAWLRLESFLRWYGTPWIKVHYNQNTVLSPFKIFFFTIFNKKKAVFGKVKKMHLRDSNS